MKREQHRPREEGVWDIAWARQELARLTQELDETETRLIELGESRIDDEPGSQADDRARWENQQLKEKMAGLYLQLIRVARLSGMRSNRRWYTKKTYEEAVAELRPGVFDGEEEDVVERRAFEAAKRAFLIADTDYRKLKD